MAIISRRESLIDGDMAMPERCPGIREFVFEGEAVLIHPKSGHLHLLNAEALLTWQRCDGRTRISEATDAIQSGLRIGSPQSEPNRDQALDRLCQLLALFAARGLLKEEVK